MPVKLVDALRQILDGWQLDLPDNWCRVLDKVELGFDQADASLELEYWEPVFPSRARAHFPGEPEGAHMLRAFDRIDPSNVRCVILGQDPYPSPEFATGRAFEAGQVAQWRELNKMFSKSVRVFMQQICEARTGNRDYARSFSDWPQLLTDIETRVFELHGPGLLADHWVAQGVLLLNSSLTISRFDKNIDAHQADGHLPVWRPLIQKVLGHCRQNENPVAFIAFGDTAIENFRLAGVTGEGVFRRPHPADAAGVLAQENPFIASNRYLSGLGAQRVAW
ncbi:MAG: uracil-DNA glycosylase [Alphaproteobacteria bacterium]|nr:uracil-DNA glycosylase [Alphaproteobacteria bacterium]